MKILNMALRVTENGQNKAELASLKTRMLILNQCDCHWLACVTLICGLQLHSSQYKHNCSIQTLTQQSFISLQQHQPLTVLETLESGMPSPEVRCQDPVRLPTPAKMTSLAPLQQFLPLSRHPSHSQLPPLLPPQQTCLIWWVQLRPSTPPRASTLAWAAHRAWATQCCPSLHHRYAWLHSYTHSAFNYSRNYLSLTTCVCVCLCLCVSVCVCVCPTVFVHWLNFSFESVISL